MGQVMQKGIEQAVNNKKSPLFLVFASYAQKTDAFAVAGFKTTDGKAGEFSGSQAQCPQQGDPGNAHSAAGFRYDPSH